MQPAVTRPTCCGADAVDERPAIGPVIARAPRPRRGRRRSRRPTCRRRPGERHEHVNGPERQEVDQREREGGSHRRLADCGGEGGPNPSRRAFQAPPGSERRENDAQQADGGDQPERQLLVPPRRRARRPRARRRIPPTASPSRSPTRGRACPAGRCQSPTPSTRSRSSRWRGPGRAAPPPGRWRSGPRRRSPWRPTSAPLKRA